MNTQMAGKRRFPNLLSPIRIGNIRLKNRMIAAPTSPSLITTEGHFTPEIVAYLEERALGGASIVTYGEGIVHSATGKSHNKQLELDAYGVKQSLSTAARAIHSAGAYANIQLSHGGKYGGLSSVGGDHVFCEVAYGPSHENTPEGEVQEMPREIIFEIIDAYGRAATLVKDCGFDMVQVHAAHGWLFSQFLSPVMNRRTDEFGGSLENRARFLTMALDAVRMAVGPSFPIEIRLAGDDLTENGLGLEACIEVAKLVNDKVDLFNISCGNHEDPEMFCRTHPSSFHPHGVNVYLAAAIKKHVTKPVACIGALNDPAQMEQIIASGQADLVEMARALVADPYLPGKASAGDEADITPCIRCYECFAETVKCEGIRCTVNPTMGQQLLEKWTRPAPTQRKRVLVAGGGPGGMMAAITAARRGHDVTLFERADKLGGNLHPAAKPYFKQDIADYCAVLTERVERSGVRVELNTEVTVDLVKQFGPDALIVAIGADQLRPKIPGLSLPHVIMAIDAEMHPEQLGKRVAILGGGLVGAEAAISFHREGRECTVIEMKPAIADEVNQFYRGALMPQVERAATIHTRTRVMEIMKDGVRCDRDGETFVVEADSVVCALGFRAPYDRVDALCALVDEYHIIGDCKKVGQIGQAVSDGYYCAMRV